ncbi:MAG: hypothetical protein K8R87_09080 [Verrucomicrobia bacterium]|nr:hypothetical protein [Verrucomicrobiota bacterium]
MRNIRAIASIMIIIGSVLVQISYKLLSDTASVSQFTHGLIQNLLPAMAGLILIHNGVKGLLNAPGPSN